MDSNIFKKSEADAYFLRNRSKYLERSVQGGATKAARLCEEYILQQMQVEGFFGGNVNLLEIGCANGNNLIYLCDKFNVLNAYGIEPSKIAVKEGNEIARKRECSCNIVVGSSDHLEFDDNMFDIVLLGFCLYLVERPYLMKTVSEVDRVLKQGGIVVIEDFDSKSPYKRAYSHNEKVSVYKMDYANLFLSNPQYKVIKKECYTFGTIGNQNSVFTKEVQNRCMTTVIYKDTIENSYILA